MKSKNIHEWLYLFYLIIDIFLTLLISINECIFCELIKTFIKIAEKSFFFMKKEISFIFLIFIDWCPHPDYFYLRIKLKLSSDKLPAAFESHLNEFFVNSLLLLQQGLHK